MLTYYKIEADTKMVDTDMLMMLKRYEKMSNPEVSSEGDLCLRNSSIRFRWKFNGEWSEE